MSHGLPKLLDVYKFEMLTESQEQCPEILVRYISGKDRSLENSRLDGRLDPLHKPH